MTAPKHDTTLIGSHVYHVCDDHGYYREPCPECARIAWLEDHQAEKLARLEHYQNIERRLREEKQ